MKQLKKVTASKYLMLCLTAIVSGDCGAIDEPHIVLVEDQVEEDLVLAYWRRAHEPPERHPDLERIEQQYERTRLQHYRTCTCSENKRNHGVCCHTQAYKRSLK